MSDIDNVFENQQRRNHVYQKFGFEIQSNSVYLETIPLDIITKEREKYND